MKPSFEIYKIERNIKLNGSHYNFFRRSKNEYGEYNKDYDITIELDGLYHEEISHITIDTNNATRIETTSRKTLRPYILTTFSRYIQSTVLIDDVVNVNGINYVVTGITNIQEKNFGIDISLEVIQNGF